MAFRTIAARLAPELFHLPVVVLPALAAILPEVAEGVAEPPEVALRPVRAQVAVAVLPVAPPQSPRIWAKPLPWRKPDKYPDRW